MQTLPSIKIKKAANQHFICKSVTMKALGDDMKLENGMILHLESHAGSITWAEC